MPKNRIFKRLKVIYLLMERAHQKNDFDKFCKLEKRAELIEYHLSEQPIINREIILKSK